MMIITTLLKCTHTCSKMKVACTKTLARLLHAHNIEMTKKHSMSQVTNSTDSKESKTVLKESAKGCHKQEQNMIPPRKKVRVNHG